MVHECTDRTSRRAEIPFPEESTKRWAAAEGGRPPCGAARSAASCGGGLSASGVSGPYTHAPCWLEASVSLKLRCCVPQLASSFGPKIGQGRKLVKKVKEMKALRMGLPAVENLSGLQEIIFSLSRRS